MLLFFTFRRLPLGDATTIIFSSPVFVMVLSLIILREPCGFFRTFIVALLLAGVILIAKPPFIFQVGTLRFIGQSEKKNFKQLLVLLVLLPYRAGLRHNRICFGPACDSFHRTKHCSHEEVQGRALLHRRTPVISLVLHLRGHPPHHLHHIRYRTGCITSWCTRMGPDSSGNCSSLNNTFMSICIYILMTVL